MPFEFSTPRPLLKCTSTGQPWLCIHSFFRSLPPRFVGAANHSSDHILRDNQATPQIHHMISPIFFYFIFLFLLPGAIVLLRSWLGGKSGISQARALCRWNECKPSHSSDGRERDFTKPSDRLCIDRILWNISGNVGLVSAGRINKDTPPLTTPSHTSKSSAMDISSYIF